MPHVHRAPLAAWLLPFLLACGPSNSFAGRPSQAGMPRTAAAPTAGAAHARAPSAGRAPAAKVSLGIDQLLSQHLDLLRGRRVGLITNPSGVDGALVQSADRLARTEGVHLVRLFGPEHGIRGDVAAGDAVDSGVDARTGIPVESLYGARKRPTPESLADLDLLLFDIQDIGSRTYTYISTLGEAMHAAAEAKKTLVVLDRPNPLGGLELEGPMREERYASFIGWGPIPLTHGMTAGEIALLYQKVLGLDCELKVVPMAGWERSMVWEDTGLTWTQTSPHIPHVASAHLYVTMGMVASSTQNVSDGVGSTLPFELCGAAFVDGHRLAAALEAEGLPGVRFQATAWKPFYGKFQGQGLRGVRLVLDDPRAFQPLETALAVLVVLWELHPEALEWVDETTFGKHWGNARVLELLRAGKGREEIRGSWREELAEFARLRETVLIY